MTYSGVGLNHTQVCPYCDKYAHNWLAPGCSIYKDTSWVDRRGGCPYFPHRDTPHKKTKQPKYSDRKYDSKNDRKGKF